MPSIFFLIILIVLGLPLVLLFRYVQLLKRHPDPIPLEVLRADPRGETQMLVLPDGGTVRTVTAGSGPAVVLAHGFSVSLREWNVVMDRLVEQGFRVIAFDQLGHGQSTLGQAPLAVSTMVAVYKQVLEAHDVKDGVLVGHSMGGFLSLAALLQLPELSSRLKGLVLFASTAGDVSRGAPQNKIQIPLLRSGILTALVRHDLFSLPFGASLMGQLPSPGAILSFREDFLAQDHAALVPILDAMVETTFYPRLHELRLPTVVICGREDKTTPPWHSERLAEGIPDAQLVWVEEHGHMLNWEAPEALITVVHQLHRDSP